MDNNLNRNGIINNFKTKKLGKVVVLIISILFVFLLGVADYISGYEFSFSIFYLIPISIAVFFTDFKLSLIVSSLSTISWFIADIYSGHTYNSILIPFWNAIMRDGYFILHSFLFAKLLELYEKTKSDSLTDSLTGVVNSRFFYKLFERELNKARRTKLPFTLLYFDLDNFKAINDKYGHQTGDLLLKILTLLISKNIRSSDILARLGGDEFALLLPESNYNESDIVIKRLKEIVENDFKERNWAVTLSIGAITFGIFNYSINDMIKKADDLMYYVKKKGKNYIEHQLDK